MRAGSVWTWRRTAFPDFPIGGWTLAYAIRGASALAWNAGWVTVVNGEYVIEIPNSANLAVIPGRYEWIITLTAAGKTYAVDQGILVVEANLTTAAAGDRQLHAESMITAIKAELERRLLPASEGGGAAAEGYQIDNHGVQKTSVAELRKMLGYYRAELRALRSGRRNSVGEPIGIRFR